MAEYIEREAVIKDIENDCLEQVIYTKTDAIWCVKSAPAADVVEVVRCRDCKHYKPPKVSAHYVNHTPYCTRIVTMKVKPDDFCSYGERRGTDG